MLILKSKSGKTFDQNIQFSSVQLLSCVWLFVTPWIASHSPPLFTIIQKVIARVIRQERNKRNLNQKEKKNWLYFQMLFSYELKILKNPPKKPIRTNKFNSCRKKSQIKIWVSTHSQKAIEKNHLKINLICGSNKIMKYLGINVTSEVENLCTKCRTLIK